jgi:hypothetical protein
MFEVLEDLHKISTSRVHIKDGSSINVNSDMPKTLNFIPFWRANESLKLS